MGDFSSFVKASRVKVSFAEPTVRLLWRTSVAREVPPHKLSSYFADVIPQFYKNPASFLNLALDGYYLSALRDALERLPTSPTFQESHFAEIAATLFAQHVLGLRRLYSKLSLLTAPNANAYKIDLFLYKPGSSPIELVLCEVKSSTKTLADKNPPKHHESCFADLFTSMRGYDRPDLLFDLAAARDHLASVPPPDCDSIRKALQPYSSPNVRFAAFVVIDDDTYRPDEAKVLAASRSSKVFEVDLLCIETFGKVVSEAYQKLQSVLAASCSA